MLSAASHRPLTWQVLWAMPPLCVFKVLSIFLMNISYICHRDYYIVCNLSIVYCNKISAQILFLFDYITIIENSELHYGGDPPGNIIQIFEPFNKIWSMEVYSNTHYKRKNSSQICYSNINSTSILLYLFTTSSSVFIFNDILKNHVHILVKTAKSSNNFLFTLRKQT